MGGSYKKNLLWGRYGYFKDLCIMKWGKEIYMLTLRYYTILLLSFEGMENVADEMLCYRTTRKKKCKRNIEDIFDGELYKKHFDCEGYFHGTSAAARGKEIHLSLMVNTDGVSIFRSSNFGLWPVYFVVNELPPEKRYHHSWSFCC